jgi:hypothetical protein
LDWGSRDNDDNEDENDDGGAAGDDSNTQVAVPLIDQDQGAANLALNEALDVTVEPRPTLPPEVEAPIENGKIVFLRPIVGNPIQEIWVMNSDGSNPERLC